MVGSSSNNSNNNNDDDARQRKMFWRSQSWSASRSAAASKNPSGEVVPNSGNGQNRPFPPQPPLTPRSQQSSKARSSLPPLQPLSIARRSLDEWPRASSDDIGEWPPQPPLTPGGGLRGNNGERLKIDLSSIQMNSDSNSNISSGSNGSNNNNNNNGNNNNGVGLLKRDRLAFFDKKCSKVADHVFLGGDSVARSRDILTTNGITHVLNCVGFVCPEYFKADFVYRTLWLQDSPTEDITSILYDVFDYFEDVREQGGRIFVHCCQGVSRSTSLVIAYLMWREGQSFDDAFQLVKAARGIADPNMGFACQLLQCQKRVHAVPLSPSSLLRMFRMAPHSPYDPLHLVPKMLTDPSPLGLDSRGAFIVHVPTAMFVWIGKNCEAMMERDARGAVSQIVRYERVEGPVLLVKEGEEPAEFWNDFSKFLPIVEKSGSILENSKSSAKVWPGERKVESYNVDYEVFQKAILGGFVPPFPLSEDDHETHLPARENSWSALRRRISAAKMKELPSAPKLSFPRVYSDSMLCIHTSVNSSPSTLVSSSTSSLSSSSPLYVSPDPISSDSNSHLMFVSDMSLDNSVVSSSLSKFSELSLSQNSTSHPVYNSNSVDIHDVISSHPRSQSASVPVKKPTTSLAERRGSLSKSLMLPLMNDKMQVIDKPSALHASQQDGVPVNGNFSSFQHLDSSLIGLGEGGSMHHNMTPTLVYSWPRLEKIDPFGASHLDSKAAFVIFSPSMPGNAGNVLYFWLGRSFNCDASQVQLDSDRKSNFLGETDWNGTGCDVLTHLSLPKNTIIKAIKQNEEPQEFLSLLSSL